MELALTEAKKAATRGEIPVGAVLVDADSTILAIEGNRTIELADPTAHAEIMALRAGCRLAGNYRLTGATLVVTLEPCPMCAGALVHARVAKVIFGARDQKGGGMLSQYWIGGDGRLNHQIVVEGGLLGEASTALLQAFFRERRNRGGE